MSKKIIAQKNLKTSLYFAGGITFGSVAVGLGVAIPVYLKIKASLSEQFQQFSDLSKYMTQLVNKLGVSDAGFSQRLENGFEVFYSDGKTMIYKEVNGQRVLMMNTNNDGTVSTAAEFNGTGALEMLDALDTARTAFADEQSGMEDILNEYKDLTDETSYRTEELVTGKSLAELIMRDKLANIDTNGKTDAEVQAEKDRATHEALAAAQKLDPTIDEAALKAALAEAQRLADAQRAQAELDRKAAEGLQLTDAEKAAQAAALLAAQNAAGAKQAEVEQQRAAAAQQVAAANEKTQNQNLDRIGQIAPADGANAQVSSQQQTLINQLSANATRWIPVFAATFGLVDDPSTPANDKRNASVIMRTSLKNALTKNGMDPGGFEQMKNEIMELIGLGHYSGEWDQPIKDEHTGDVVLAHKKILSAAEILNTFADSVQDQRRILILNIKVKDMSSGEIVEHILIGRPIPPISYNLSRFTTISPSDFNGDLNQFANFRSSILQVSAAAKSNISQNMRNKAIDLISSELDTRYEGHSNANFIKPVSNANVFSEITSFVENFVNTIKDDQIKSSLYSDIYFHLFSAYFVTGRDFKFTANKLGLLLEKALQLDNSITKTRDIPSDAPVGALPDSYPLIERLVPNPENRPVLKYVYNKIFGKDNIDLDSLYDSLLVSEPLINSLKINSYVATNAPEIYLEVKYKAHLEQISNLITDQSWIPDGFKTVDESERKNIWNTFFNKNAAGIVTIIKSSDTDITQQIKDSIKFSLQNYFEKIVNSNPEIILNKNNSTHLEQLFALANDSTWKPNGNDIADQNTRYKVLQDLIDNFYDKTKEIILSSDADITQQIKDSILFTNQSIFSMIISKEPLVLFDKSNKNRIMQIINLIKDSTWQPDGTQPVTASDAVRAKALDDFFNAKVISTTYDLALNVIKSSSTDITVRIKQLILVSASMSPEQLTDRVNNGEAAAQTVNANPNLSDSDKQTIQSSIEKVVWVKELTQEHMNIILEYVKNVFKLFADPKEAAAQLNKVLDPTKLTEDADGDKKFDLIEKIRTLNQWVVAINKPNITLNDIKDYAWTLGIESTTLIGTPSVSSNDDIIVGASLNPHDEKVRYVAHQSGALYEFSRAGDKTNVTKEGSYKENNTPTNTGYVSTSAIDADGNLYVISLNAGGDGYRLFKYEYNQTTKKYAADPKVIAVKNTGEVIHGVFRSLTISGTKLIAITSDTSTDEPTYLTIDITDFDKAITKHDQDIQTINQILNSIVDTNTSQSNTDVGNQLFTQPTTTKASDFGISDPSNLGVATITYKYKDSDPLTGKILLTATITLNNITATKDFIVSGYKTLPNTPAKTLTPKAQEIKPSYATVESKAEKLPSFPSGFNTSWTTTGFANGNKNYVVIPTVNASQVFKLIIYEVTANGLVLSSEINIPETLVPKTELPTKPDDITGSTSSDFANNNGTIFILTRNGSIFALSLDMSSTPKLDETQSNVIMRHDQIQGIAGKTIDTFRGIAYNRLKHTITFMADAGTDATKKIMIYIPDQTANIKDIYQALLTH